jgi:hypothetical protein
MTLVKRVSRIASAIGAMAAVAVLPATAGAASTTSVVTGVVGSELSLSAATPSNIALTHAVAGTASSVITVTSTQTSWTLKIKDAGATTPGQMDKTSGAAGSPSSLANALDWRLTAGSFAALSGSDATVTTGSLVGTATVDFRQALGATEGVTDGDVYSLTATYTVT